MFRVPVVTRSLSLSALLLEMLIHSIAVYEKNSVILSAHLHAARAAATCFPSAIAAWGYLG